MEDNGILVLGSTVVDIIIEVERLPGTGEDCNVQDQHMQVGGMAYNVSDILRHAAVPHRLCSPVGTGVYGDFIKEAFREKGITPFVEVNAPNRCCYCFVEPSGERTFMGHHGAEYSFHAEWMERVPPESFNTVYVCGLEIEEPTGAELVGWLEKQTGKTIFFAPSSRLVGISEDLLNRMLALSPILHVNETEALQLAERITAQGGVPSTQKAGTTGAEAASATLQAGNGAAAATQEAHHAAQNTLEAAAQTLARATQNTVIITTGADGAWFMEGEGEPLCHVPAVPCTKVRDTIGAGDGHAGAFLAYRVKGYSTAEAIRAANRVAAAVVGVRGATLTQEEFTAIGL